MKGNSTSNGANCQIYQSNEGDCQKFLISENSDGSYIILLFLEILGEEFDHSKFSCIWQKRIHLIGLLLLSVLS